MRSSPLARLRLIAPGGGGGPQNVLPATIDADPVIGTAMSVTAGTWDDTYTLTYQWQYSADGSTNWTNVSGATAIDWTPTDTEFGYFLRVAETADGETTAYSAASAARVAEIPACIGSDVLVNGDFANWTGDNPDNWTLVGTEGASYITEVASGGGAGTGAARMVQDTSQIAITQTVLSVGSWYQWHLVISALSGPGTGHFNDGSSQNIILIGGVGTRREIARATLTTVLLGPRTSTWDGTFDEAHVVQVDQNAELAAPSADMRLDFFYTLPGSPVLGSAVWVLPRISSFASGNYWLARLRYTGSAWDIELYSVASFALTSRISATGIGTTNGIRVNMNGDNISLYTTADGGDNWTQRGSTITNSLYDTATGVNVMHTADVTPGPLVYAPAD